MAWNVNDGCPAPDPRRDGSDDGNGKSTATMAPKRPDPPRPVSKINTGRLVFLWVLRLALLAGIAYCVIQAYS